MRVAKLQASPTTGTRGVHADGAQFKAARKRSLLTLEALARTSGVSVATIRRAEQGDVLSLESMRILAQALGAPVHTLLASTEDREEPTQRPRSQAPAVAVLPFKVIGSNEKLAYFADGLVEDLIHRLERSLFPVVDAASTLGRAARSLSREELVRGLGAEYLVIGSTRRVGKSVRVSARLLRASNHQVLFSEQYERIDAEVFAAQDELCSRIVERVDGSMLQTVSTELAHREASDLSAWELSVRGSQHFFAGKAEHNALARKHFEQAVTKCPDLALAWYSLAMTHQREIVNQWSLDPAASLAAMKAVHAQFHRYHPRDPRRLIVGSYISLYSGERGAATDLLSEAIEANPNLAPAHSLYGQTLAMANEPERALASLDTALRLSPFDPERWSVYTAMALSHFVAERYGESAVWARKATALRPEVAFPHGTLAAALGQLGRPEEAREELGTMLRLSPGASLKGMATLIASTNVEIARRYQAGLRVAGMAS